MSEIADYLRSRGVNVKSDGAQIRCSCWYCGEAPEKRGRMYVASEGDNVGLHHCFLCGEKGGLRSLRKHFGDPVDESPLPGERTLAVLDAASRYYEECLDVDHLKYLRHERGFTLDTIKKARFGFCPAGKGTMKRLIAEGFSYREIKDAGLMNPDSTDFLSGRITFPYLAAGYVVTLRGKQVGAKYASLPGSKTRLYNSDAALGSEDVVVAEGEMDALLLAQLGFNAVGVPGASSWQESFNSYFEDAKRVWVLFDPDPAGVAGAVKVARALDKAKILTLPVPVDTEPAEVDVSWLVNTQGWTADNFSNLMEVTKREGSLLKSVDDTLGEYDLLRNSVGLRTGFEMLDNFIRPGLLPGQVVVVLARTGDGKTQWVLNLLQRTSMIEPDSRFLLFSLEQTAVEVWTRQMKIWSFYNLQVRANDVLKKAADYWRPRLHFVDENRISISKFRATVEEYAEQTGGMPSMIIVDYLGYWAMGFKGTSRYERLSDAVMELKALAKEYRVPIIVPHQVRRGSDAGTELELDDARDSVTGDTRILLADGRYVAIRDLVGTTPVVTTVDAKYHLVARPTTRVWEKGSRRVLRVTTQTGRRLRGTPEHPMLTADGGWTHLSKLSVGDRIAIPKEAAVFGSQHVPHAQLLGHLIANGGLTRVPITYTNGVKSVRDRVAELAQQAGVDPKVKKGQPLTLVLSTPGRQPNPVNDLVRENGIFGYHSPDRFVPSAIFEAEPKDVAAFLRGLISSDGSGLEKRGVSYTTTSERLAREVQHLLSRFGIVSSLTHERSDAALPGGGPVRRCHFWRVCVRQYEAVALFDEVIGLEGVKGEKLERYLGTRRSPKQNFDMYPGTLLEEIHESRRLNGLGWAALSPSGNHYRTGLSGPQVPIGREKLRWLSEQVGSVRLHDLASSPIAFDKIVAIEDGGEEPVYDMTVVGTHNFVGDFVYSNSGTVPETGDIVLSLWSPDSRKGKDMADFTGEVILKIIKSRNGGKGMSVKLQRGPISLVLLGLEDPRHVLASNEYKLLRSMPNIEWADVVEQHRVGDNALSVNPLNR